MLDFRECLYRYGLEDLGFEGHEFTWSNKQGGWEYSEETL